MHTKSRALHPILVVQAVLAATLLLFVASARADSTPVGPLPNGPVSTVNTQRGSLVAVALPRPKASSGLVWRVARRFDTSVVRQADEVDTASSIVVVFKVVGRGKASIVFAQTRGEASPDAVRSHTTKVVSRG
jgi:hypothetical protein